MGLFDIFKKSSEPYNDHSTNEFYQLLFCDNLDLFNKNHSEVYPWNILFSKPVNETELQKIINDDGAEARVKVLAYNKLFETKQKINKKELLGVIVEVGFDKGVDVLASYKDGTARYINQSGKIIVWETTDETSNALTIELFKNSETIVSNIGPWDKARRLPPTKGNARITFLVSDGLYFGEAPIKTLFKDPLASPALTTAAAFVKYLTDKVLQQEK